MSSWTIRAGRAAAAAAVAAGVLAGAAGAAPLAGGTFVRGTWGTPTYLYLTAPGCAFAPRDAATEARTSSLTAPYEGWLGPLEDTDYNPHQAVRLRTHVAGTVEDGAGRTYRLAGNFLDSTTHFLFDQDLLFDGQGVATLAGPAGVVTGTAELRVVSAPLEYALVFTAVRRCEISPAG